MWPLASFMYAPRRGDSGEARWLVSWVRVQQKRVLVANRFHRRRVPERIRGSQGQIRANETRGKRPDSCVSEMAGGRREKVGARLCTRERVEQAIIVWTTRVQ
jgi:hypothetical protein